MLRWLRQQGCAFSQDTTLFAARRADNLPILKYLVNEGCQLHDDVCCETSGCNDLEHMQWLHAHGAAVSTKAACRAASAGAVDILVWLQQQGVGFDVYVMMSAAQNSHLHVCIWLYAANCPVNDSVYYHTASNNRPEILDWLLANNTLDWLVKYPVYVDRLCITIAIYADDAAMLQVLHKHGLLTDAERLTDTLERACFENKLVATNF
jgi:hypothetical protein